MQVADPEPTGESEPTPVEDETEAGTTTGETGTEEETDEKTKQSWLSKTAEGVGYSFAFIFLSELGDKTFLFVVVYSSRMNGFKLLVISSIGLCGMHVVAVAVGNVFQYLLSESFLKLVTVASFLIIGVVFIVMGIMEEEDTETEEEMFRKIEVEMVDKNSRKLSIEEDNDQLIENGSEGKNMHNAKFDKSEYMEYVGIITTIICTEMADRSQVAAVALAANYKFWIVAVAGSLGHICALVLAIGFGKAVSHMTSEK